MGSALSMSRRMTTAGSSIGANMICRTVKAACDEVMMVASGRTSMVLGSSEAGTASG